MFSNVYKSHQSLGLIHLGQTYKFYSYYTEVSLATRSFLVFGKIPSPFSLDSGDLVHVNFNHD